MYVVKIGIFDVRCFVVDLGGRVIAVASNIGKSLGPS